jgi:hypothetical protein
VPPTAIPYRRILQLKFKVTSDARSPAVPAKLNFRKVAHYERHIAALAQHLVRAARLVKRQPLRDQRLDVALF